MAIELHPLEGARDGLADRRIAGSELACRDVPAFSVQYHPEAAPGPHDARYLFDEFVRAMERSARGAA